MASEAPMSLKRDSCCLEEEETPSETQSKMLKTKNVSHETEGADTAEPVDVDQAKQIETSGELSKSQLKKLRKKERWERSKEFRRAKEKERTKQKRLEAKLNNVQLGPSRKVLKNAKMATSKCKVSIVIDMSFDDLMDDRSVGKCNKQLLHCYSLNRRAENPLQLHFTSMAGKSLAEMEKHQGYRNWDVHVLSEHYMDVFPPERLVYLTSESENEVSSLEQDKVYIIGGLVDHNAHKGHCYEIAKQKGIQHAQLPIGQFLEMKTRKVLTIDHVFTILLQVSAGASWQDAFLQVLPQRKGARGREELQEGVQESGKQSDDESNGPSDEASPPETSQT